MNSTIVTYMYESDRDNCHAFQGLQVNVWYDTVCLNLTLPLLELFWYLLANYSGKKYDKNNM